MDLGENGRVMEREARPWVLHTIVVAVTASCTLVQPRDREWTRQSQYQRNPEDEKTRAIERRAAEREARGKSVPVPDPGANAVSHTTGHESASVEPRDDEFPTAERLAALLEKCRGVRVPAAMVRCLPVLAEDDVHGFQSDGRTLLARHMSARGSEAPARLRALVGLPGTDPRDASGCAATSTVGLDEEALRGLACGFTLVAKQVDDFMSGRPAPAYDAAITAREKAFRGFRSDEGFLKLKWGMTPAEVKKLYPKAKVLPQGIGIETEVAGATALVALLLPSSRLTTAHAHFGGELLDNTASVKRYVELRALLTEKYGKPTTQDADWDGATLSTVADSIMLGEGGLYSWWQTDKTTIELRCGRGQLGTPVTVLEYTSRELWKLDEKQDEADKAKAMEGL